MVWARASSMSRTLRHRSLVRNLDVVADVVVGLTSSTQRLLLTWSSTTPGQMEVPQLRWPQLLVLLSAVLLLWLEPLVGESLFLLLMALLHVRDS